MKNLIGRCLATATLIQLAASAFAQSWNLVWREDFGVAEDTVLRDFLEPGKTVMNHKFAKWDSNSYETYDQTLGKNVTVTEWTDNGECGIVGDGTYGIANSTKWATYRPAHCNTQHFFHPGRDHTGNEKGAMLIVNAGGEPGDDIYTQDINFDLCDSKKYRFGLYTASITHYPLDEETKADLTLEVYDRKSNTLIKSIRTGPIPQWDGGTDPFTEQKWSFYSFEFTVSGSVELTLKVINHRESGGGNDFVLDDISLWRFDEDVELPDLSISESAIASENGGNCSYDAIYTIPEDIMKVWRTVDNAVYVLWQKSNNGYEWTNLNDQSGIEKSKLSLAIDGTESPSFRVIITASPTAAEAKAQAEYIAENGGPMDGCAYYSISQSLASIKPEPNCKYKENLKTLWKEDFGVCDTFGYKSDAGMKLTPYVPGGNDEMSQKGEYIICAVPDSAIYRMTCDWDGSNCKKAKQFNPYVQGGTSTPSDVSYVRADAVGDAFAFIRMNKQNCKDAPTIYKKAVSLPLCPCKSFMFNAAVLCKGSDWGTTLIPKLSVLSSTGDTLGTESTFMNFKGFGKQIATAPFFVPTGYSGDVTLVLELDYNTKDQYGNTSGDYTDFAIDDLSVTVCGEVMTKPTISIDGKPSLALLSGFDCTDDTPHSVIMSGMDDLKRDYPNAAFIWQTSVDGGDTWSNSSETSTSIAYDGEPEVLYRVVIGESQSVANEVAANGKPTDNCSVFYITNAVGFKCKESGCRAPKFSLSNEDKVMTIDSVFCGDPGEVKINVFQTNRVNVDDFYVATMGADNNYGAPTVMSPAPTSTDGSWKLSFAATSAKYMVYAMNDTCKSDTVYINLDVREKIELKPIEDQMFCGTETPSFVAELASGKAELIYLKYGSTETKIQFISGKADVVFPEKASLVGNVDVTAYAEDRDKKCKSEEITINMDYEDEPDFTLTSDKSKVCSGNMAELKLDITSSHNSSNHLYTITASDGGAVALDNLNVYPSDATTTYTVTAKSEVCNKTKEEHVDVEVEFPQPIDLAAMPSLELKISENDTIVCAPANVSFQVTGENLTTWDWESKKKNETEFSKLNAASTETVKEYEITEETSFRVSTTVESSNVCDKSFSKIITIKAESKPNFSLALDHERVCETGDVELSLVTTETYDPSQITAKANETPITLTNNKYSATISEETKFEVIVAGKVCEQTPDDITAYVDHPLSFEMTVDKEKICEGESVTFTVTGTTDGIVWYKKTEGGNYETFVPETGNKLTPTENVYVYAGTPSDGACGEFNVDPIKIEVEKQISFDLVSDATGTICPGTPVNISIDNLVGTPKSSKWEKNGLEITAVRNLTDSPVSTSTYKVTLFGDVCAEVFHDITVDVETADALSLTTDKSLICEGDFVTLTPNYGTNDPAVVKWWKEVDGNTTQITETLKVYPEQSTSYYLSIPGTVCSEAYSDPAKVDVEPKMDFDLTADANGLICEGTEVTLKLDLKSGRADNVTFTANDTPDSYDIVKNKTYKVKPTEETLYELTLKGSVCDELTKFVKIDVQKKPKLSVVIDKTSICEGDDVTITPTSENVDDLAWDYIIDDAAPVQLLKSTSPQVLNPSKTTTYTIKTVNSDVCGTESWEQKVEVEPAYTVSFDANVAVACPGEEVEVKANVTGISDATKFQWKKSVDGTNFNSVGHTSDPTIVKTTLDATTDFRLVVSGKVCQPDSAQTKAIIDVVPTMTLETTKDSICEGEEVILSTKFSVDNFDETSIELKNETDVLTTGQQSTQIILNSSMLFTVSATTPSGCLIKPAQTPVFVDNAISVDVPSDTALCEGESVKLSAKGNAGYQYTWTINNDVVSTNHKLVYEGTEPVDVKLDVLSKVCKESYNIGVNVVETPHIVSIEESGSNKFEFVAEGGNGIYQFDFGDGYQSSSILDPATYGRYYTIKVKDELGCESDTTIKTPVYELEFPAAFTPDGDGVDDVWVIKNIDKYPSASIRLYDRYGKKLCDMTSEEMEAWDGKYNGKDLPSTDYWYEIQIDEIDKTYAGHFTLIRNSK